ncbi:MAG: hypothetical protein ACKESB_02785 [Candidatus Hodgkinia cicadicola]
MELSILQRKKYWICLRQQINHNKEKAAKRDFNRFVLKTWSYGKVRTITHLDDAEERINVGRWQPLHASQHVFLRPLPASILVEALNETHLSVLRTQRLHLYPTMITTWHQQRLAIKYLLNVTISTLSQTTVWTTQVGSTEKKHTEFKPLRFAVSWTRKRKQALRHDPDVRLSCCT